MLAQVSAWRDKSRLSCAHMPPRRGAPEGAGNRNVRQRLLDSMGKAYVSDHAMKVLAAMFMPELDGDGEDSVPQSLTQLWEERVGKETPYGPVVKRVMLPAVRGGMIPLYFLCPLGIWTWLAGEVPWLFVEVLAPLAEAFAHVFHVILYEDGATTGNLLSHDPAKAMELFYWTFEELGLSRLGHTDWWVCLASLRTQLANRVAGGLSHVSKVLLLELQKLTEGFTIHGPSGESLVLFGTFGGFMFDESAQMSIMHFKGARP